MKTAIITGGASGLGKAIAQKLLSEKNRVAVIDYDESRLDALHKEYPQILCKKADLTSLEEAATTINNIFTEFQKIDILVNSAGILYNEPLVSFGAGSLKKHSAESFDRVIKSNLYSTFYASTETIEKMIMKRTKGVIINISSITACGNAGQTAYSAAKAGINAFTSTWAKELGIFGIRFVSIAPGYIDTESTKNILSENMLDQITQKIPSRKLGKTSDIVEAVLFAIHNNYLNGKILQIDGGLTI